MAAPSGRIAACTCMGQTSAEPAAIPASMPQGMSAPSSAAQSQAAATGAVSPPGRHSIVSTMASACIACAIRRSVVKSFPGMSRTPG